MSLPPGLPPLPKSLSAAVEVREADNFLQKPCNAGASLEQQLSSVNLGGASCSRNSQRQGSLSSAQDSASDRDSVHSRASSSLSAHDTPTSTSTLDSQIAILRREMYSLRQLDLSLLSQLWALNESIQGFRTFLQEREDLSPSPTPSNTNSISSDERDDESFSPLPHAPPIPTVAGSGSSASQASSSTSASNSLSAATAHSSQLKHVAARTHSQQSVGRTQSLQSSARPLSQQSSLRSSSQQNSVRSKPHETGARPKSQESSGHRAHPQLPSILQQRMRRPPPPPPPTRGKSPSKTPEQQGHV